MNPFNIRQPQDRRKIYNEYMALNPIRLVVYYLLYILYL